MVMPMRSLRRPVLSGLLILSSAAWFPLTARAQQDDPGSADHPAVARFPGFYIDDYQSADFDGYEFITGEDGRGNDIKASKEGRFWRIVYRLKDNQRSPSVLEIIRNYESAFKRNNGSMVWSSREHGLATYRQTFASGERWVGLEISDQGGAIQMRIIEVAAMKQKVEFSSSEMLDALNKDGFIALNGLLFDTGKDAIQAPSEPLLQEIHTLLSSTPELRLSIEGHTDNVGTASSNAALSTRRAEAVKAWLVGKGIAATRLSTQGFGDTRPIGDNRTEAGRARNRRVELVKLK